MQSKLLVTSQSNIEIVKYAQYFNDFKIIVIDKALSKAPKPFKGEVWGMGGGAVIDAAKLYAGEKSCYAIPTNASGAACTSHSVLWTKTKKIDIKTPMPIISSLFKDHHFHLSKINLQRTMTDCQCHIAESSNSIKATAQSKDFCRLAKKNLMFFIKSGNTNNLITAGNWAGRAIEITGTNFIHAISYVLTLQYGYCHGDALKEAMLVRHRRNYKDIMAKAALYPKFHESIV